MSITWTIRRGDGDERTLEDWGISSFVRQLQSLAEDACVVGLKGGSISAVMPFEVGEIVSVRRDGVQYFFGRCGQESPAADGSSEGMSFRIDGPGWWLSRLIFRQQSRFALWPIELDVDLPHPTGPDGDWDLTGLTDKEREEQLWVLRDPASYKRRWAMASAIILGQDEEGKSEYTDTTIRRILEYAINQGAPFQIGTIDPGVKMPLDSVRDQSCWALIRRQVQWTPDIGSYFDYSTEPPTLHLRAADNRPDVDLVYGADTERVALEARHDLLVTGVTINYIRRSTRTGLTLSSIEQDSAGETEGVGALHATVELRGEAMADAKGKLYLQGEPTPSGVASRLYSAYNKLLHQGNITLALDDCADGHFLGSAINVIGGGARPDWATMRALVQQQEDDIMMGRTRLDLGPPAHLSPQDFVARLQASRGLHPVDLETASTAVNGGFPSPDKASPAEGPPPSLTFAGQEIDLVLYSHAYGSYSGIGSGWVYASDYLWYYPTAGSGTDLPEGKVDFPGHGEIVTVATRFGTIRVGGILVYHGQPDDCPTPARSLTVYTQISGGGGFSSFAINYPAIPCLGG